MDALRPDASRGPSWLAAFLHGLDSCRTLGASADGIQLRI